MANNEEKKAFLLTKKKHYLYVTKRKDSLQVRYDLKENRLERPIKGSDEWIWVEHQYVFFQGYGVHDIEFENDKFKKLIKLTCELNPNCESLSTFLSRLADTFVYEGYVIEGINFSCWVSTSYGYSGRSYRVRGVKQPLNIYTKPVIDFFKNNDIKVTEDIEEKWLKNKKVIEKVILKISNIDISPENKYKFFRLAVGYSSDRLDTLVNTYNYDIKALAEYIYNYLEPFEGMREDNAITTLRDYYDMASTIGRKVKKYPKYLKSMHDIIQSNYRAYKEHYDQQAFLEKMNSELEYSDKKYCIINPTKTNDIISEGTDLNHCVGSYVKRILREETYIMFLRSKKTPDESLVTLEYKDKKIIQAKGQYNRKMEENERKFVEKYCKIKKIELEVL